MGQEGVVPAANAPQLLQYDCHVRDLTLIVYTFKKVDEVLRDGTGQEQLS